MEEAADFGADFVAPGAGSEPRDAGFVRGDVRLPEPECSLRPARYRVNVRSRAVVVA